MIVKSAEDILSHLRQCQLGVYLANAEVLQDGVAHGALHAGAIFTGEQHCSDVLRLGGDLDGAIYDQL